MAILKPMPSSPRRFVDRHARIGENHRARRLGVPAHLALVGAERNAGRVAGNDDRRNPGRPFAAGARHHDVEIAGAGARDELLLAVEHVMIAVAHGARRQRRRVGTGAGLGQAIARQKLHRAQFRQPFLALRIGAVGVDHPGGHVVDRHIGRRPSGSRWRAPRRSTSRRAATAPSRRRPRRYRRRPCRVPRPCAFRRPGNAWPRPRRSRAVRRLRRRRRAPCREPRSDLRPRQTAASCRRKISSMGGVQPGGRSRGANLQDTERLSRQIA